MEDLMKSVSSARKEFQERRLSRTRGSNSISSADLQSNNHSKNIRNQYPNGIAQLSVSKNDSERSKTDRGVASFLHHSVSVTKLSSDEMNNYRGPLVIPISNKLKNTENSYDSRLRDSSVMSPSRSYLRSYKLDAAKLLVGKIKHFMSKKFKIWKERTEHLRREEKAILYRKASYLKVSIGSSQDLKARNIVYSDQKYDPGSYVTPKSASNSSVRSDDSGKKYLSHEESRNFRNPIVEVIYEDNKHKLISPDKLSQSYSKSISTNATPLSSFTLTSTKSSQNFGHFQVPTKNLTSGYIDNDKTSSIVKISVILIFIIKRRLAESVLEIKKFGIKTKKIKGCKRLVKLLDNKLHDFFGKVKSSPFRSLKLKNDNSRSLTSFFDDIQSRINKLRSSRVQIRKYPEMLIEKLEKIDQIIKVKLLKLVFHNLKEISAVSAKKIKQVMILFIKNIVKDSKYRLSACFDH